MANPFFSVIIPTYNRAGLLKIAVDSVLEQTFSDYELIVIDDGSSDNTQDLMKAKQYRQLRYIYTPDNGGVSRARNKGITLARGEYIALLDSDDRFRKDKLEISAGFIRHHPGCKIFHSEEIWYKRGKIVTQKKRHKKPSGNIFAQALPICCVSPSTAIIHRSVFSAIGLFDEQLPACEDYDFWLRATSKYTAELIPEYLTIKEGGRADQQSERYPAMDKLRIYALEKILRGKTLNREQYTLACQELEKKCSIYTQGAAKRDNMEEVNGNDQNV